MRSVNASVVDLFCGAGGMSLGFQQAGFDVVAGFDSNEECRYPFEANHKGASFFGGDVLAVPGGTIKSLFTPLATRVLIACCPCQAYSGLARRPAVRAPETTELDAFGKQVSDIDADVVVMENVPDLKTWEGGETWRRLLAALHGCGYGVNGFVLDARDCGVAQSRKRLIVVAAKEGFVRKPDSLKEVRFGTGPLPGLTLRDAIGDLPPLAAGESHPDDPLHVCSNLSPINIARAKASKPGGNWYDDWPAELRLPRQQELKEASKEAMRANGMWFRVYCRKRWDEPASTLSTEFTDIGTGPNIHPGQDRGYSLREGARIQGFPDDFEFVEPGSKLRITKVAELIGNAVPPPMGKCIAERIAIDLFGTEGSHEAQDRHS